MKKKDKFLLFLADLLSPSEKNKIVKNIEDNNEVIVMAPYYLTKEEVDFLKKKFDFLDGKKIKNIINKEILGGLIILYQNKIIDLSLKGHLFQLKKLLMKTIHDE